mgnify:FL=1
MLKVLIAEDKMKISVQLSNAINTENVRCIEILNEGSNVYQRIKELKPDALILDLKLSGKNGIDILKEIESDEEIKTRVIIYSDNIGSVVQAVEYKCVDRYFSKLTPVEEISIVLEKMVEEVSKKNTKAKIFDILLNLGFTYSLQGTKFMNECILYSIVEDEDNIKKVYEEIARRKGKNVHTIKSDINTAIKSMWRYGDKAKTRKILRLGDMDKPSSKGIISMIKYYVVN